MKLKIKLQYIATPAKIFMAVLVILCLLSILQGICIEIERTYARAKRLTAKEKPEAELSQEERRQDRIRSSSKEFLADGTIHLISRLERTSGQRNQSEKVQIYDVNDKLLWEGPRDKKPYEYLFWDRQFQVSRDAFTQQDLKRTQMITPGFSRYIEIPVSSDSKIEQIWRYHPAAQYFKGYDMRGETIGYVGSNGFTESKSEVKPLGEFRQFTAWCPVDSYNPILLLQTQKSIYQINFEKQEVELIFESTDSDIRRVNLFAWIDAKSDDKEYADPNKYRPLLHCETRDGKHHLILREPKQQLSLNLRRPSVSVVATKQDIFVRNIGSDMPPLPDINSSQQLVDKWVQEVQKKSWNMWTELYKVKNNGELELVNSYKYVRPPLSEPVAKARDPRPVVQRYVCQFSPPLYDLIIRYFGERFWSGSYLYQNRGDFFYDLLKVILEIRPYDGIINRILSVIMMGFVFWHGWSRRTSWARFIFWLIFTGLFNIAGLLTYLALNHTAVIKCPVCGKLRGLTQVDCVRCQGQLPAPERGKLDLIFSA
ncbi:MAG: hypothetical protein ISS77_08055 [Phycisphaerae bacterium]|nr:hypothetical protein [Phycisphaerae bacterium]